MTFDQRVQTALRSSQPVVALRALVQELAREGNAKAVIYELLEKYVVALRSQPDHREADQEAVLDVLDALSCECHPTAELLPEKRV